MLPKQHLLTASALLISLPLSAFAATTPAAPAPTTAAPAAVAAPANPSAPVTHQELPALIKDYIMKNPEIIIEAVDKMREKQQAAQQKQALETLAKYRAELISDPNAPSLGDAKTADVTVIQFFDYHCGYCKRLLPDINKLMSEDKKVRIIFKEFPILSDDSVAAARAALAVNSLNKAKYFEYHSELMKHQGEYSEKALLDIGKKIGIDSAKLKAEIAKPEITAELDKVRKLAEELGIRGTPAVIVGETIHSGAPSYEDLKKSVAEARKKPGAPSAAPAAAAPAN